MKFKISKNIPVPDKHSKGRPRVYMFDKMEIGDSIAGPLSMVMAGYWYHSKKRKNKVRFTARREGEQYRLWRIK